MRWNLLVPFGMTAMVFLAHPALSGPADFTPPGQQNSSSETQRLLGLPPMTGDVVPVRDTETGLYPSLQRAGSVAKPGDEAEEILHSIPSPDALRPIDVPRQSPGYQFEPPTYRPR